MKPAPRRRRASTANRSSLAALTAAAMQLHRAFAAHARRRGRPPWTAEQVMQGFVVDVGALMKLVMAKSGAREVPDADRKLAHELADCLWSVLVLAQLHDVALEAEFSRMLEDVTRSLRPPRARHRSARSKTSTPTRA